MASFAAALPMILSTVGTVVSTISSIQSARQESANADFQAKLATQRAAVDERNYRRKAAFVLSKQEAIGAGSGVDVSSGSPLTMTLDSAFQAEMDALNIRAGGQAQSKAYKMAARQARGQIPGLVIGGLAKAGGSIFSQMKSPLNNKVTDYQKLPSWY